MTNKMICHYIVKLEPFTVNYINMLTGAYKLEEYSVPLLKKEIEAEYDYIVFPNAHNVCNECFSAYTGNSRCSCGL